MTYYQVFVSAENKEQATAILDALLEKQLVLGGPILEGPAQFWWKEERIEMGYAYLVTYTTDKHKDTVIRVAIEASKEEVPMISFIPFEGNSELLALIDKTIG
ncbi:MAG TPA: divalent cation tolerance protein CutA [Candidatus Paceibacterota bacterium]